MQKKWKEFKYCDDWIWIELYIPWQTGASVQGCLQSALPSFLQHWPPRSLLNTSDTSAHSLLSFLLVLIVSSWVCPFLGSGEIIFVGTLLPLASHKSAVGRTIVKSTDTWCGSALYLLRAHWMYRSPVFTLSVPSGGLLAQRAHIPGTE